MEKNLGQSGKEMKLSDFQEFIEAEFEDCLKRFPELRGVELIIEEASELAGAAGKRKDKKVVILFVPPIMFDKPNSLRPIIFHELSHLVDKEDPDRIFFERADRESQRLWWLLQDNDALDCIVEIAEEEKEE